MNRLARIGLGCAFALLATAHATAQQPATRTRTPSAGANKLISLKTTGTARYTDQEILAASGGVSRLW